jgi:hypothetical protein
MDLRGAVVILSAVFSQTLGRLSGLFCCARSNTDDDLEAKQKHGLVSLDCVADGDGEWLSDNFVAANVAVPRT